MYRRDFEKRQPDNAVAWYSQWMGGPTLAAVENCRLVNLEGDMRRLVVVTGEPDTYFSIPAKCSIGGAIVRGYITVEDDCFVFRHTYY